jgi:regulator of protease activity HflC (stomatin/prohibitin superfamily)
MTEDTIFQFIIRALSIGGLLGIHLLLPLSGRLRGSSRQLKWSLGQLALFDWALLMGILAGRSIAVEGQPPFWSFNTIMWGGLGICLLYLPVHLIFHFGFRWSGTFLLPVMPLDRQARQQAGQALVNYMRGFNYPFHLEEFGELKKTVSGSIMLRNAGPGVVVADSHYAIPVTAGTHDTHVGGHGLTFTGRLERPRPPIDLRLQVRAKSVEALTRDGIAVKMTMFAIFQVDRRGAQDDGLYPVDPQAVYACVHAQGVTPEDGQPEEKTWDHFVVARAANLLRDAIARMPLDRLLESETDSGPPPREALRAGAARELAQMMEPHGIQVMGIGLGDIEVQDEEVMQQRIESWKARWERRRKEKEGESEAYRQRLIEKARAGAQAQMVSAMGEICQQLKDAKIPLSNYVVALCLLDIMEDMAAAPIARGLLPENWQMFPQHLRSSLQGKLNRPSEPSSE